MSNGVPTSTDKNIVDLTRSHHSRAAAKAVRTTRERLQSDQGVSPAFDVEILGMHLSATLQGAAVMPAVLLLVAGFGTYLKSEPRLFIWAILALSIHALCILVVKRASKAVITPENHKRWRQFLLAGQVAMGCSWAVFATQQCTTCGGSGFVFFKGAVLLLVLSITAMANMLLRQAVLFGFFPTVAALAYISLTGRQMLDLGLTAVFTTALIFFIYITNRLHQANLKLLSFQTEKDDLIAELEVAKSLSDEARRRAEEANMAKSRFLASMSHELRTPLNAILGFSEVMATEILGPLNNPLYKEYAGDIHRSGKHLLELINEILDLSRIEAGKYELSEEVVSLLELAEDGIGMIQLRAKSKNIRIEEQFEQNLPSVWADEKAMRQVVLNLLSNAVKFTPQGGEIIVKAGWTAGGGQYVSIRDNGPGIPENEIPVVLSAFGQGSIAIKSAEQGTGLGLPIVQAILAKHGGEFKLKSKLREGTEVIAILPSSRVLESLPAVSEAKAVEPRRRQFA
ncbi:integral membrane sensor signal transduction histidine kinase [Rhizobium sp. PDO1-076]|uniref:sensor histidine kinase n=1 Tax=Rhizobium sp. PDO1-076 TaxID=1125979 RepID=UPI00024E3AB4|nr:HAMP domain-containing sensor histidine kinase [Rhizobium sp. PDO1-076]EHS53284.1 integral membrane sensor signal transduction histidine kinase [Rhizobium sp. PDO1-076]